MASLTNSVSEACCALFRAEFIADTRAYIIAYEHGGFRELAREQAKRFVRRSIGGPPDDEDWLAFMCVKYGLEPDSVRSVMWRVEREIEGGYRP